jgi:hypothetical protein
MRASTHSQPRYYGSLFNLEHRLMSGAVVTLAVIVLVLLGQEGRAVQAGLDLDVVTPSADRPYDGQLDGWVRPAEIRVHAPVVGRPILDERLLQRFRLLEPPKSASPTVGRVTAADAQLILVPARPGAVQVGPPDVADYRHGESLAPIPPRASIAPANGRIGR